MVLAVGFGFLAAFGFASGAIFIRIAIQRVAPATAAFLGVATGAVLINVLSASFYLSDIRSLSLSTLAWFALMGTMAYPLARLLNYTAISMIGVSRSAPMRSVETIVALGLGVVFLGERPNLPVALGAPIVALGLLLVIAKGAEGGSEEPKGARNNLGYLLAIGSSAAFAGRDTISRHLVVSTAPPVVAAAFSLVVGGLILMIITHRDLMRTIRWVPLRYIGTCAMAGVCSSLAVTSVFLALSRAEITVVSPILATSPLFTLALAHLFLQRLESINRFLVIGAMLSVGGVGMVILGAAR